MDIMHGLICFIVSIVLKPFVLSEYAPMSHTALAVFAAGFAGFSYFQQRALDTDLPPVETPAPEPVWLEPSSGPCQGPALECPPCPICLLQSQILLWQIGLLLILVFLSGCLVGSCLCERLCGFPQPTVRHGRSIVRRSTTGHAVAG